jgi:hypothetical protein
MERLSVVARLSTPAGSPFMISDAERLKELGASVFDAGAIARR